MNALPPGLIAAPFTAFHDNGELKLDLVEVQARSLSNNGVVGAFVCGTTGEGPSLSSEERCRVVEAWVKSRTDRLKVIVHVGHASAAEARLLARHAQDSGADAVASVAPYFFKPASVDELVNWCADVAAAAPRLPFYYYHIPSITNVTIPTSAFLAAARHRIPNLAGIKFTHEDLEDYAATRAIGGKDHDVLFGRDELLLEGLRAGATGAVGSTYNYAAPLYQSLIAAFRSRDLETAASEQAKARAFIDVMIKFGGLPAGKAIMKLIGIDCGPVRLPLKRFRPEDEQLLRRGLEAVKFFEFCSKTAS